MSEISPTENPVDFSAFFYNPRLLFAPCYYGPLALRALQPYMDGTYTPRWFTAPVNPNVAIGAGLTVREQLRITPGSVIAGWRIATLGGASVSDLKYQVTDGDTQQSFTQGSNQYLNCLSLVPSGATGLPFCIFPTPYKVGGGVITVAISNSNVSAAIKCQMLIYVLEPVPAHQQEGN